MKLLTLGKLELTGATLTRVKPLLLLTYLALEGTKDRRYLSELFWPAAADPLNSLTAALKQVRHFAPGAIVAGHTHVSSAVECDATTFLQVINANHYEQALRLYQGPFLSGSYLKGWSAELEEWVYGTREFLAGRMRAVLFRIAEVEALQGQFESAAKRAEKAYLLSGAPEPGPEELERLYTLMLAGGSLQASDVCKEAASFGINLQLSAGAAKELLAKAVSAEHPTPHNLPSRITSFVGRDLEITEMTNLLAASACRLLTLTGPGGIGKTRLALEVANLLLKSGHFKDGIHFVALESLTAPSFIPSSLASVLGFDLQGLGEPLSQIAHHLGTKHLLLFFDNFEHLLEGATLVSDLLRACPNLKVLATSRECLTLEEEWIFAVEGLTYPDYSSSPQAEHKYFDAVQLFVERAKRAQSRFVLDQTNLPSILKVCRLVDGLPLAIELAAAWVKILSPSEIAQEIDRNVDLFATSTRNIPERHKSIRAVFEHSWKLLSPKEQEVLRKLSVFQGGFRREAAAEVAGATISLLLNLVNKSLLRVSSEGRYNEHPLVHQYLQEKLAENSEEKEWAQDRHSSFFIRLLERWGPQIWTANVIEALLLMDEDLENCLAAWNWAMTGQRAEELRRAFEAVHWYHEARTRFQEGAALLAKTGASLTESNPAHQVVLGAVLCGQAWQCHQLGRNDEATQLVQSGLALFSTPEQTWEAWTGWMTAGLITWIQGNYIEARSCFQKATSLAEAQQRPINHAFSKNHLALVEEALGNDQRALQLHQETLTYNQQVGDGYGVIFSLRHMGSLHLHMGRLEEAQVLLQEGLNLMGKSFLVGKSFKDSPYLLRDSGRIAFERGAYSEAKVLCYEALKYARVSGDHDALERVLITLGRTEAALGGHQAAAELFTESLQIAYSAGEIPRVLECLIAFAELSIRQGQLTRAYQWLTFTLQHPATAWPEKDSATKLLVVLEARFPAGKLEEAHKPDEKLSLDVVVQHLMQCDWQAT